MTPEEKAPRKIIRDKVVTERTGKGRVQRWRDIRAGTFPAPIQLGPNSIGWYEDEIADWLASRPRRTYSAGSAIALLLLVAWVVWEIASLLALAA